LRSTSFGDPEAVEAGHLDVEEDEVRVVFFDEVNGFEAVFALADDGDFGVRLLRRKASSSRAGLFRRRR